MDRKCKYEPFIFVLFDRYLLCRTNECLKHSKIHCVLDNVDTHPMWSRAGVVESLYRCVLYKALFNHVRH